VPDEAVQPTIEDLQRDNRLLNLGLDLGKPEAAFIRNGYSPDMPDGDILAAAERLSVLRGTQPAEPAANEAPSQQTVQGGQTWGQLPNGERVLIMGHDPSQPLPTIQMPGAASTTQVPQPTQVQVQPYQQGAVSVGDAQTLLAQSAGQQGPPQGEDENPYVRARRQAIQVAKAGGTGIDAVAQFIDSVARSAWAGDDRVKHVSKFVESRGAQPNDWWDERIQRRGVGIAQDVY
jgi:hypothetical protein